LVLARDVGLLALYMKREDRASALRVLDGLYGKLPEDARKEAESTFEKMKEYIRDGLWDDAWGLYQNIVDIIAKYDPVISAYVPRETYEAYEKAAKPEETISSYARGVLEGTRSPATPPNGLAATRRVEEQVRAAIGEADWEKHIREQLAALGQEADWERELRELMKPEEVEWEKRLREYLSIA